MNTGITFTGVGEVKRILEQIAPRHARNIMRATVHGIAGAVAKDAKDGAPVGSGTLKKAIKAKRRNTRDPNNPQSDVIVEHGNVKNDAYYWRFVEYGTGGGKGSHLAGIIMPDAHPFMKPAATKAKQNLKEIMIEQFGKKLEAALKREAKKNK